MIESARIDQIVQEIMDELTQQMLRKYITDILAMWCGPDPAVTAALESIVDEQSLRDLYRFAVLCRHLVAFQARLASS
jgi:hypothetical protein